MHFHTDSICKNCGQLEHYSTPLPDILIAGDLCTRCGAPDVIGVLGGGIVYCDECGPAYAHRIWQRYLNGEGDPAGR